MKNKDKNVGVIYIYIYYKHIYQAQTRRTLPAPLNNPLIGETVARLWFSSVLPATKVLTISLFDSQEHHHGADEEHSSYDTGSYHVHLLLQRQTENKHTQPVSIRLAQPPRPSLF